MRRKFEVPAWGMALGLFVAFSIGVGLGAQPTPTTATSSSAESSFDEPGETTTTMALTTTTIPPTTTTTAPPGPKGEFSDGTHEVGKDILPGRYRNVDAEGTCYWARLRGFGRELGDIISNGLEQAPTVVTISPRDAGFESKGCGTWAKLG